MLPQAVHPPATSSACSPVRPQSSYSERSTIRRVTPSPDRLKQGAVGAPPASKSNDQSLDVENGSTTPHNSFGAGHQDTPLPAPRPSPAAPTATTISRIPQPVSSIGKKRGANFSSSARITTPNKGLQQVFNENALSPPGPSPRKHRDLTPRTWQKGRMEYYGGSMRSNSSAKAAQEKSAEPVLKEPPEAGIIENDVDDVRKDPGPFKSLPPDDPFDHQPVAKDFALTPTKPPHQQSQEDSRRTKHRRRHKVNFINSPPTQPPLSRSNAIRRQNHHHPDISPTPKRPAQTSPTQTEHAHATITPVSQRSVFRTPGRDDMERKKGKLQPFHIRDGPFGLATGVRELSEERRRMVEGEVDEGKKRAGAGCRCAVM